MGDKKSCRFDSRAMVVKCHREVARHRLLPSVRASLATLALLGIIAVAGCSGDTTKDADSQAGGPRTVKLALNWFPEPEHGGFYAALLEGDFAAEGLEVEIIPGGPGAPVIPQLEVGRVEFGVVNGDQLLVQRGQGADVVATLAPLQSSPRCILVHASSGIERLEDLKNVTLAVGPGQPFVKFLEQSVSLEGVQMVPYSGRIAPFVADPKMAQQGYTFAEPVFAEAEGAKVTVLPVSALGFDPYASCVVVHRRLLERDPELVEKFTRACMRGWERYLANPEKVNQKLAELNPELNREHLVEAHRRLVPLCEVSPGERLGKMSAERWSRLADQLTQMAFIDDATDATRAFVDPLTSE